MKGNYGIVTTLQTNFSILIQIKQSVLWLFVSLQSFAKFQTFIDLIHSLSFTQTDFVTPKNKLLWWQFYMVVKKKTPLNKQLPAGVVWDEVATVLETVWTEEKQNTT